MENIRQDLRRTCRCFWNSELMFRCPPVLLQAGLSKQVHQNHWVLECVGG